MGLPMVTTTATTTTTARRQDGRNGNDLRPLTSEQGALFRADGSARLSHGSSTVLAAVYGPGQGKWRSEKTDRATLDVCFKLAKGVLTSKENEYEQIIRETFTPVVLTESFPRAVISIVVQVLQDNGSISFPRLVSIAALTVRVCCCSRARVSVYTCRVLRQLVVLNRTLATAFCRLCQHVLAVAINAVCLALMDAGIPMISVITASSCGIAADGCLNLDPSSVEEEEAVAWVTTARSSTSDGVLTCITSGLLSEEQYFACSEACQRASESVAAFFRTVQEKKYPIESTSQ